VRIAIERVTTPNDDVRALISELEQVLHAEYPPEQRHGLSLDAIFQPHIQFFVAHGDTGAVGCGGVALFADLAEVKRMYVRAPARRKGVAEALLEHIEAAVHAAGLVRLCLETGDRQLAAMRVYDRTGFSRCTAFGHYAAMPPEKIAASIFYEKYLRTTDR
jgi:putative acetyltransferase